MPARKILEEIVYVLRTGGQWKALPKEGLASSSAIHTYFLRGAESGFLVTLWPVGLAEYDEMEGISWKWPSIDGAIVKAALAPETVGQNPTDRKKGSRPNLLVDGRGVALSLVVSGANRSDVSQLEIVWDEIVIERPDDIELQPCTDKGYNGDLA